MSPPLNQVARWITCPECHRRVGVSRKKGLIFKHTPANSSSVTPTPAFESQFNCPSSGKPAPVEAAS